MYNLFTKTLRDKRAFMIGWGLGLLFMGYLITTFFPAFNQDDALSTLVANLPPAMKGLIGDLANLKELSTYLGGQLFDIRMPIFLSVLTIILALNLTVGEEEKGQLRTLVALPLSRTQIVVQKWLAILIICTVAIATTIGGIVLGIVVIHETIDPMVLVRLGAMTLLLTVAMATFVFGFGLATGQRGLTMAVAIVVMVGSFLLTTFAQAVDWLQPYAPWSLFYYFPAPDIATGTIEPSTLIVYGTIIIVSLLVAILCFRRRDIRG